MNKSQERSKEFEKILAQERFILMATEEIWTAMESKGVSKAQLAKKLKKTKPFITQLLSGSRNMTLRTFAELADALGVVPKIALKGYEVIIAGAESNDFNEYLEEIDIRYFAVGNLRNLHPKQFMNFAENHDDVQDWTELEAA